MSEQKPQQQPSVGRVVHFVYGDKHVPAIITDPAVDGVTDDGRTIPGIEQALTVFPVGEPPFTTQAIQDERGTAATWHWPEYVPARQEPTDLLTPAAAPSADDLRRPVSAKEPKSFA